MDRLGGQLESLTELAVTSKPEVGELEVVERSRKGRDWKMVGQKTSWRVANAGTRTVLVATSEARSRKRTGDRSRLETMETREDRGPEITEGRRTARMN